MQSIIRETILAQLLYVPTLVDQYSQQESRFTDNTVDWLRKTEKALEPFRLPLVSRLSGFRGLVVATSEGLAEGANCKITRKQKRGQTMQMVQQAEIALREHVEGIDRQFEEYRDKLSQILAVASSREPLPATSTITTGYLDKIWEQAKAAQDNPTLALYLQGRIAETDRRYLLGDIIGHLLAQPATN